MSYSIFHKYRPYLLRIITVGLLVVLCIFELFHRQTHATIKPDFKNMQVNERKIAFIDYMVPFIKASNQKLLLERQKIIALKERLDRQGYLSKDGYNTIHKLYKENKLGLSLAVSNADFKKLLKRVDIVPPALALAQAALESGWGTSRFAVKGNNYFGLHCFTSGCGLIPTGRGPDSTMEVTAYNTPEEGVMGYMYRLNTGSHFKAFRDIRAKIRSKNLDFKTSELLQGLHHYSELGGEEYMNLLQAVIKQNNLEKYE